MRRRVASLVAIASLLVGACAPTASPGPSAASPGPTRPASGLGDRLRAAIDAGAILADLRELERLTAEAGGSRYAGGEGEATAGAYVTRQLQAAGFGVSRHEVTLPVFRQTGPGALEIEAPGAPGFTALTDYKPSLLSPAGDVTAPIVALGFDPDASPGATSGPGCAASDWAAFPSGSIALVQPGSCRTRDVIQHAQDAGAAAVIRSYPGWAAGQVLRPTLVDPRGLEIPVLAVTHAVGVALQRAASGGQSVRVAVETTTSMERSASIIAETPGGDPTHVVMLGGHLDSVIDGPGINDDGSGVMTILEIGRRLATLGSAVDPPAAKVRIAFWTGEEIGLWGSFAWFNQASARDRAALAAYLNLDMLGSPNGVREIYHWSEDGNPGSAPLEALFQQAFALEGLTADLVQIGSSDDLAFGQAGVPTSGLFSGHNVPKTAGQAAAFGGTVGAPLDPCYHLACDTFANLDPELLGQMARAAAWVTGELAGGAAAAP